MTQHKWHKEIKAWADGADIEVCKIGTWYETDYPNFHDNDDKFRIKPQPVEVVASGQPFRFKEKKYLYAYIFNGTAMLTETHSGAASGGRYIGKIEVQDDL